MEQAFQKAKVALFEAASLAQPQSEPELSLAVVAAGPLQYTKVQRVNP